MEKKPQYKVIVSDRARQMVADHVRFLANTSIPAARKVRTELVNAMRSLRQLPERFPFLSADFIPPNKYHKMFVQKRYLVLYQIKGGTVYIDYVLDCRQDYGWLAE